MKKIFIILCIMINCLCVFDINKIYAQDAGVVEVSSGNVFDNRTQEQEEPIPDFSLRIGGEERLYTVIQGQPSPVSGTLFNAAAAAWLESQIQLWKQSYAVHLNTQLNLIRTRARLEVDSLQLTLNTERETTRITIEARDRQIEELVNQVRILTDNGVTSHRSHHRRRIILATTFTFVGTLVTTAYITYKIAN